MLKLKIPPPIIGLLSAALMWLTAGQMAVAEFDFAMKTPMAVVLAVTGLALDVLAWQGFRAGKTTINPMNPSASSQLVTGGVYRLSRNPMYLGLLLVLTGFGLWLGNLAALLVLPGFVAYITVFQIMPEEHVLAGLFGQAYVDYTARVRRWL